MGPSISEALEILGLTTDASLKEIKQAYKDLVNVWHPDRFTNNPRLQKKANEKLQEINAAYEILVSFYENRNSSKSETFHSQEPPKQPPPEPPSQPPPDKPRNQPRYTQYKGFIIIMFIVGFLFLLWGQNDKTKNKFAQPDPKSVEPLSTPLVTSPKILDETKIELRKRDQTQITDKEIKRPSLARLTPPRESKIEKGLSTQSQTTTLGKPDLSQLTSEEKTSIESSCYLEKMSQGPANYNRCLNKYLDELARGERKPDLSQLTSEEKTSIESSCYLEKMSRGPANYNRCLNKYLKQLYGR